ncbi:MAG TPA: trypsin-like peptidase domain-containing protein [Candidatus Acidoferrales bacterium]|nr:trypsin-like peptidase domain-containing protein [Candidatus Acidoferrales bacterium]
MSTRGHTLEARVLGISRETDLALLKIEAQGLPALPIGKYSNVRQGELVFAFGSPEGLRNSVTMGVVSSVARQPNLDSPMVYIQTDAPINPGNSGGPLVNVDGELVGINTFILTLSGGNEGLGFAIPSGVVAFAYPQLRKYGHLHRGEIAASVQTITPTLAAGLSLTRDYGVIVSDVIPGGPADKGGLKIQDIILSVNGRATDSLPLFGLSFYLHGAGERAKFEVLRGSEKLLLEIRMVERPHDVDRLLETVGPEKNLVRRLGILGIELDPKLAKMFQNLRESSGVIVAARVVNSGGTDSSLATGDIIHALNGTPVTSLEGLRSVLDRLKPDSAVALQIERDGKLMYVTLQMEGE